MLKASSRRQDGSRADKTPSSLLPGRRERRWLLAVAVAAMLLASMTGCDGGPAFGTRVEVENECDVDVAIAFGLANTSSPDRPTTQEIDLLRAGEAGEWLLRPIKASAPTIEYLWVAIPGAPAWGSPTEVDIGALPQRTGTDGRVLRITDDLCPG